MKKTLVSLALFVVSLMTTAQVPTLKAQSVLDVDLNDNVSVQDVNSVVRKVAGQETSDRTTVDTEKLNLILGAIYSRLVLIESRLGIGTSTYEYVDLGLSKGTLWATCNIGATKASEVGDYYAWGEIAPQSDNKYDWSSYLWCNGTKATLTKYCTDAASWDGTGTMDGTTVLSADDDAATANWGDDWCMPTIEQWEELLDPEYTSVTWTSQDGVNGRKITSKKNGNSIFLPVTGFYVGTNLKSLSAGGYYWSSSLCSEGSDSAGYLFLNDSSCKTVHGDGSRCLGFPIRPVRK